MATGGIRQKRALNTVELFDPKRPKVFIILSVFYMYQHLQGWLEEDEQADDARCSVRALCCHPEGQVPVVLRCFTAFG